MKLVEFNTDRRFEKADACKTICHSLVKNLDREITDQKDNNNDRLKISIVIILKFVLIMDEKCIDFKL